MSPRVSNEAIKNMLRQRARDADDMALTEVLRVLAIAPQDATARPHPRLLVAVAVAMLLTAALIGGALLLGYWLPQPDSMLPLDGLAYSNGCAVVSRDLGQSTGNETAPDVLVPRLDGGCPWPMAYELSWSSDGRFLAYSGSDFFCGGCNSESAQQAIRDSGVWVLDTETGRRSQLRPGCVTQFCGYDTVVISPDGSRLAYTYAGSYWVTDVATLRTFELGKAPRVPVSAAIAWSPDSTRLALIDNAKLFVVSVDGSTRTTVFDSGASAIRDPAWAPNGQQIVFALSGSEGGIWTIHPDGSGLGIIGPAGGSPAHPTWSPDGRRIAYVGRGPGPGSGIWVMSADGSDARALEPECSCAFSISAPAWAPAGDHLAYVRSNKLYVAGLDGSTPRLIESLKTFGGGFAWTPPPPAWRPALPGEAAE